MSAAEVQQVPTKEVGNNYQGGEFTQITMSRTAMAIVATLKNFAMLLLTILLENEQSKLASTFTGKFAQTNAQALQQEGLDQESASEWQGYAQMGGAGIGIVGQFVPSAGENANKDQIEMLQNQRDALQTLKDNINNPGAQALIVAQGQKQIPEFNPDWIDPLKGGQFLEKQAVTQRNLKGYGWKQTPGEPGVLRGDETPQLRELDPLLPVGAQAEADQANAAAQAAAEAQAAAVHGAGFAAHAVQEAQTAEGVAAQGTAEAQLDLAKARQAEEAANAEVDEKQKALDDYNNHPAAYREGRFKLLTDGVKDAQTAAGKAAAARATAEGTYKEAQEKVEGATRAREAAQEAQAEANAKVTEATQAAQAAQTAAAAKQAELQQANGPVDIESAMQAIKRQDRAAETTYAEQIKTALDKKIDNLTMDINSKAQNIGGYSGTRQNIVNALSQQLAPGLGTSQSAKYQADVGSDKKDGALATAVTQQTTSMVQTFQGQINNTFQLVGQAISALGQISTSANSS